MVPKIFGSINRDLSSISLFEIRLHNEPVVLRGRANEAAHAVLRGTVVLCLNNALHVRSLRLQFKGRRKLGCFERNSYVTEECRLIQREWNFIPLGESTVLPKGNYTYDFEQEVGGEWYESFEGLHDTWVVYRLRARLERALLLPSSTIRKRVRIIRTLDSIAVELLQPSKFDGIWGDRIKYVMSTPHQGVVFGTEIPLDFKLIPLQKGLTVESITGQVEEFRRVRLFSLLNEDDRIVVRSEWTVPENTETVEMDGHYGWKFHQVIQLPKSLNGCLQSLQMDRIRVKHQVKCTVRLRKPGDRHLTIHGKFPIFIYLSPLLPLDDNNSIIDNPGPIPHVSHNFNYPGPPLYDVHQFDQPYSEVNTSGYMTPAAGPSGLNTPFVAGGTPSADNHATMLRSRLHGLGSLSSSRDRVNILPAPDEALEADIPGSSREGEAATNANANATSSTLPPDDDPPQHLIEFDTEALSKVPSYTTARQSRPPTTLHNDLPTYQSATHMPFTSVATAPSAAPVPAPVPVMRPPPSPNTTRPRPPRRNNLLDLIPGFESRAGRVDENRRGQDE